MIPQEMIAALQDNLGYDSHRGYSLGWDAVRENPGAALFRVPFKVSYFVAAETGSVAWNVKGLDRALSLGVSSFLLVLANAAYLVVLASACLALLARPERSRIGRFTVLLSVYMLAVVTVFFGDPRFHLPLVPFMLLLGASLFAGETPWPQPGLAGSLLVSRRRLQVWAGVMVTLGLLMAINLAQRHAEGAW